MEDLAGVHEDIYLALLLQRVEKAELTRTSNMLINTLDCMYIEAFRI